MSKLLLGHGTETKITGTT